MRRRNEYLEKTVVDLRKSRDKWRTRALAKDHYVTAAERRRIMGTKRSYTIDEWRQHDLIVARIRALG